MELTDEQIAKYFKFFKRKIKSYKNQDNIRLRGRLVFNNKTYITAFWATAKIYRQDGRCIYCGCYMQLPDVNKKVEKLNENADAIINIKSKRRRPKWNLITIDRLDSGCIHLKNNCVICCYRCNIRKSNSNPVYYRNIMKKKHGALSKEVKDYIISSLM